MSNDAVDLAMHAVGRRGFLPASEQRLAEADRPLPIGLGQTNSQPRTVAAMLRLLDVTAGAHVLDVGAGSGWTTALLAHLVGPTGRVLGVELEPSLAAWGAANLAATATSGAEIRVALPGVLGWPDDAPFDRILVSATAARLPDALVAQLAPDGVMVCVVGATLLRVAARRDHDHAITRHGSYSFVPLRSSPLST